MAITQIRKEQIASVDVDSLDCSSNLKTFLNLANSANLAAAVSDETGTGSLVFADSPALVTPDLGTPSAGTLTSCTGLPISSGVSGLAAGVATFLATPSSTNLISAVTGETGTGALVFATSPTLVTPTLGTPASGTLTNCTTSNPVSGTDIANKQYVDQVAAGLSWKDSVKAATTSSITLSGAQTIDDISIVSGDRVLVKNQASADENGIYVCDASTWSRATDMDDAAEFSGSAVFVQQGTANGDQGYVCTNDGSVTVGSTNINFTQFTGTGAINYGIGLFADANTIHLSMVEEIFDANDTSTGFAAAVSQNNSSASSIDYRVLASGKFSGDAPRAAADGNNERSSLFIQVHLNGILAATLRESDTVNATYIVDALSGDTSGSYSGPEMDFVLVITEDSADFDLYALSESIQAGDLVTVTYASA